MDFFAVLKTSGADTGAKRRNPNSFASIARYLFAPSAVYPCNARPLFLTAYATITGRDLFKHGSTIRRSPGWKRPSVHHIGQVSLCSLSDSLAANAKAGNGTFLTMRYTIIKCESHSKASSSQHRWIGTTYGNSWSRERRTTQK